MLNRHHLYPTSRGWRGHSKNLVMLDEKFHANFHSVFENRTPTEQIRALLELNAPALRREFSRRVADVLNANDNFIYEGGVFRRK